MFSKLIVFPDPFSARSRYEAVLGAVLFCCRLSWAYGGHDLSWPEILRLPNEAVRIQDGKDPAIRLVSPFWLSLKALGIAGRQKINKTQVNSARAQKNVFPRSYVASPPDPYG